MELYGIWRKMIWQKQFSCGLVGDNIVKTVKRPFPSLRVLANRNDHSAHA
jgi:hypothetical protein